MNEANTVAVGAALPRLAAVRPAGGRTIAFTWAGGPRVGITEEVDLSPTILTLKFYAPLRDDPKLFATVDLADDGYTLIWDGGRVDMAATTVEHLCGLDRH